MELMELFDLFEREDRERKGAAGAQPSRRGGIRGFFDRMFSGHDEDDDDRGQRYGDRAYDHDARQRRRDNDGFDFD